MGVPQGSVLSPLLFNFFVRDFSTSADLTNSYTDDVHAASSAVKPADIAASLGVAANELSVQAESIGMSLSAPKSTVSLFTPWTAQFNGLPAVTVGGIDIPLDKNPKLLGLRLDPSVTFGPHASQTARKANSRLNVIRALASTSFGQDKECLIITFKSLIRPFFDYGAPLIYPNRPLMLPRDTSY